METTIIDLHLLQDLNSVLQIEPLLRQETFQIIEAEAIMVDNKRIRFSISQLLGQLRRRLQLEQAVCMIDFTVIREVLL